MANYEISIKLTNFINSEVISYDNGDGLEKRGVFIPLDDNGISVTDRGHVYCRAFVAERTFQAVDKSTHYIKQKVAKKHVEKLKSMGYEVPYLGSMHPSYHSYNAENNKLNSDLIQRYRSVIKKNK